MKKIFILMLAAAAVAVSCQKHQVDSPITPVAGPTVDISVVSSSVDDSTFTVVFTPKVENDDISYYSFLVYESEVPEELDSTTLYQCGYEGVASGTVKYAEDSKTYELQLTAADGINPNTVYQIAAVAGSKMGVPGAISTDDVLTSDSLNPQPTGTPTSDTKLGCITIKFTKDIHLATENGAKAYATYKRVWYPHEAEPADSIWMEVDSIIVEGNEMTLFAPVKISGAYVFFTWDKGLVKSDVDSSCAEYKTVIFDAKGGKATKASPCYFRFPTTSFGWTRMSYSKDKSAYVETPEDSLIAFVEPESYYVLQPDKDIFTTEPLEDIEVTYKNSKKTSVFSTCEIAFGGDTLLALNFNKNEEPDFGDKVNYSIEEDSFEDVWGNYNEAYENEDNFLRSYGYTVDDFLGSFVLTQTDGAKTNFTDTIKIDSYSNDTVKISGLGRNTPVLKDYYGFTPSDTPIRGIVDGVLGTLTIVPIDYVGTSYFGGKTYDVGTSGYVEDYVQFLMEEKGAYTLNDPYIFFSFYQDGTFIGYPDGAFSKVTSITPLSAFSGTLPTIKDAAPKRTLQIGPISTKKPKL